MPGTFVKTIESQPIFQLGSATSTFDQTISTVTPTWTDVTYLVTDISLTRDAVVLFMLNVSGYHADVDGIMYLRILMDDIIQVGPKIAIIQGASASLLQTASLTYAYKVPAGAHTVKVQATVTKTTGTIKSSSNNSVLSYIVLTK